ncbi:hypothetical protein [Thermogutta sp.]|uniref:hypothetical protein n=1 Tax=Thermogutta sp. TaxID=1962930 RepID=UPI00321F6A3E
MLDNQGKSVIREGNPWAKFQFQREIARLRLPFPHASCRPACLNLASPSRLGVAAT